MKTTLRVLTLVVLVAAMGLSDWHGNPGQVALAGPTAPALSISASGTVGEGDDFATTVLGDPWDMSQQSDVILWNDFPSASITSGVFSYNMPPTFWAGVPLLMPDGNQINVGKIGAVYPIDAGRYHWLSFRIKQPAGSGIVVIWNFGSSVTDDAHLYIPVTTSDWHTYVIDLKTYSTGKMGSWSGQVTGLHVQSNAPSGSQVSLDWARLTADNPASNSLNISWSGLSGAPARVDFYLDKSNTGCAGTLIHTEPSAPASGSFAWGNSANDQAAPANFAPGTYYVCAKSGSTTVYSGSQVTINQAPIFRFTKPSYTSGPDYATEAGNPWDMDDASDVSSVANGTASFQSGLLAVHATAGQSDQQVQMNLPNGVPIDSSRYHYLTYRVMYNYPTLYYVDSGQFSRIYWGTPMQESKLIYLFPGWQTFSFDLRTLPANWGPAWATSNWTSFRLDPIANKGHDVTFYIDDVKLAGDTVADTYVDIEWQMTDPDTAVTTATLYYDTDPSGLNGTPFATFTLTNGQHLVATPSSTTNVKASIWGSGELTPTIYLPLVVNNYRPPCSGACYSWDTTAKPAGTYWLYACLDDGYNHQICRYSETPLIISHP